MKENEDKKNVQLLVEKVMKQIPLESPSLDFTSVVMANVLSVNTKKATDYKPVISQRGWLILFGSIIAAITYFIFRGNTQTGGSSESFGFDITGFTKTFNSAYLFQFSGTTINVIFLATVMLLIQIALLKNYLDRRVENKFP